MPVVSWPPRCANRSDSNPAAVLFPNGSLLMMWRGAGCACSKECPALASPLPGACAANTHSCWQSRLHVARADHWSNVSSYATLRASPRQRAQWPWL